MAAAAAREPTDHTVSFAASRQHPHQHHAVNFHNQPSNGHAHSPPDKMVRDVPLAFPFSLTAYQAPQPQSQVSPTSLPMQGMQQPSGPQSGGSQSITTTVSPTSQTYNSHARGSNHNLNMAEFLDPADKDMQVCAPKAPFFSNAPPPRGRVPSVEPDFVVNENDDPVSLHALSEVEANSLVQL